MAGKRKGKEDERHLWPEMLRVIREIAPSYIVGENVLGLVNWDGGLVFAEVQADLESEGYEVATVVIPAAAVNAPHGRDRVWFIAHATSNKDNWNGQGGFYTKPTRFDEPRLTANAHSNGQHQCNCEHEINASERRINAQCDFEQSIVNGNATDTDKLSNNNKSNIGSNAKIVEQRRQEREGLLSRKPNGRNCENNGNAADTTSSGRREVRRERESRFNDKACAPNDWDNFPTQSPICSGDDGLPGQLDGITFSKWRNESIKAYGNAVCPQVVYQIFRAIEAIDKEVRNG